MSTDSFVHLHVHTEYSTLDSTVRTKELVALAAELAMPSVAITDHGNRLQEIAVILASLLGTDLQDTARFFDNLADQLAFVDRERQRFFAIDVFTGLHGFDGDLRVPVVRCGNRNQVDVVALE